MAATLYGQTDAEQRFESAKKCRDIVQEIVKFGVSQEQLARLIYLLALELEDVEAMRSISSTARKLYDPLDEATTEQRCLTR